MLLFSVRQCPIEYETRTTANLFILRMFPPFGINSWEGVPDLHGMPDFDLLLISCRTRNHEKIPSSGRLCRPCLISSS